MGKHAPWFTLVTIKTFHIHTSTQHLLHDSEWGHVTLALSLKIQSSREGEMTRRYTAILCRGEATVTSCCRLAMACRICWAAYWGVMPRRVVASVTVRGLDHQF